MRIWGDRLYHLSITSAFVVAGFALGAIGFDSQALAQNSIIPDNTLGNENSQINRETIRGIESDRISGGARRGQNLFHSFEQFDVGEGLGAYFDNPEAVMNIFSRVTGSDPSDILGRLGVIQAGSSDVLGNANLFFINPNGILFGPNASLDLGGSFAATTANGMQFGDQGFFSTTNPGVPSQLLTIDPSAFFFNQLTGGNIINDSATPTGFTTPLGNEVLGLRVPDGNSLLLIGGDITMNGGRLNALGGRIELGGLAEAGIIGLDVDGSLLQLSFPPDRLRSNLTLTNDARISTRGSGGGDIAVNANSFIASSGGRLVTGTEGFNDAGEITVNANNLNLSGVGESNSASGLYNSVSRNASGNAGDIVVTARTVNIESGANILNQALNGARGNAGDINITTDSLATRSVSVTNPRADYNLTLIESAVFEAQGNAGDITVDANTITLAGIETRRSENGNVVASEIRSNVFSGGIGDTGRVTIRANSLTLEDGAQIASNNRGQGGVGGVYIYLTNSLIATGGTGRNNLSNSSGVLSNIEDGGVGAGGTIIIRANSLSLENGAQIQSIVRGVENDPISGNGIGGNIDIDVDNLSISGRRNVSSGLFTNLGRGATGRAGNIIIRTRLLSLTDSGRLSSITRGQGDAGNITIRASDSVELAGGYIFSSVEAGANGNAGIIDIQTQSLTLTSTPTAVSQISVSLAPQNGNIPGGRGRGGEVLITADSVNIAGTSPDGFSSGIFANTRRGALGPSGNVIINANSFRIADGGVVTTQTQNPGEGGNITINTSSFEALTGGEIVANTFDRGRAGDITLLANRVILSGSDPDFERRFGEFGDTVVANVSSASGLFVNTEANSIGSGGTITIQADSLLLSKGAEISAATSGSGNPGNIIIRRADAITLDNSSIATTINSGAILSNPNADQSNIDIQTRSLSLTNNANITASTSGQGNAGNVAIRDAEIITLDRGSIFTAVNENAIGEGGDIEIQTDHLTVSDRAQISASTEGQGRAGNIVVDADTVNLFDRGQLITSTSTNQRAGDITLTADVLNLDRGRISAESTGTGRAGDITLNLADRLQVSNGQILTSAEQASGGAITINAENADVRLSGTSDISTSVGSGAGSGGTIAVTAETIELRDDSDIRTSVAGGQGSGGNIRLRATSILAFDDSDVIAAAPEGQGGDITFNTAAFFGENYFDSDDRSNERLTQAELEALDQNGQVDVDATGALSSGTITTPDTSFIQNSLSDLPDTALDSETLVADSCVVRSPRQAGRFIITGGGGLPQSPGIAPLSSYATGTVRSIPEETPTESQRWQPGDPIVEPQNAYRLEDGRVVLSRECAF